MNIQCRYHLNGIHLNGIHKDSNTSLRCILNSVKTKELNPELNGYCREHKKIIKDSLLNKQILTNFQFTLESHISKVSEFIVKGLKENKEVITLSFLDKIPIHMFELCKLINARYNVNSRWNISKSINGVECIEIVLKIPKIPNSSIQYPVMV
jgi:hypothetical protein